MPTIFERIKLDANMLLVILNYFRYTPLYCIVWVGGIITPLFMISVLKPAFVIGA